MQNEMNAIKQTLFNTENNRAQENQPQLEQIDQTRVSSPPIPAVEPLNTNNVVQQTDSNTIPAPIFHGHPLELPRQFLKQVKTFTETVYRWKEDRLLREMALFLQDVALEWYCQLRDQRLPKTWDDFKEIFIAQFDSPICRARREEQWKDCLQTDGETTSQFVARLRSLWEEQFPQETEADFVYHLLCKIRQDILNTIKCQTNASLEEILSQAKSAEEILHHRAELNDPY